MRPRLRGTAAFALVSLALLPPLAAGATDAEPAPLELALSFLARGHLEDPYQGTALTTVAEAVAQAGVDVRAWPARDATLFAGLGEYGGPDGVEYSWLRVAHAVGTAGYDPTDVNGRNFTALVLGAIEDGEAVGPDFVNDEIWTILALRAAGFPATDPHVQSAADKLILERSADGGWAYRRNLLNGNTDITGMALVALKAAGRLDAGDERARLFLDSTYDPARGGHVGRPNENEPNCQSTVWAIHGYRALGRTPRADLLAFLESLQRADGGFMSSATSDRSDVLCTAETIPVLAGARAPFPGHAAVAVEAPDIVQAGDAAQLRAAGPFSRAAWTIGGTEATGLGVSVVFETPGTYEWSVHASSSESRGRAHGTLVVSPALPRVELALPPAQAWRHAPITVDASTSTSPTGELARMEVDWGDGNRTSGAALVATHAYALPGAREVTVRVQDSSGAWSPPVSFAVDVRNRAPLLDALPPRLVANRTAPFDLGARATDADGDAVTLRWRLDADAREGEGPVDLAGLAPGDHDLALLASDAFGGVAYAHVTLDVVNLPPLLLDVTVPREARAGEPFAFAARAVDPDGPAPVVRWNFTHATHDGASGNASLPAGSHAFEARATDLDGATRTLTGTILVREGAHTQEAADAEALPPRVANVSAVFEGAYLVVRFEQEPADALARVRWASDAGEGAADAVGGVRVPLADATRVEVVVELETAGGRASAQAEARRETRPSAFAPPRLSLAAPSARVGDVVRLAGEPPEDATAIRFDFGDGLVTPWSSTRDVVHVYEAPGAYEVRLEARAADGRVSVAHAALEVFPRPPLFEPALAFDASEVVVVAPPPPPPLAPTTELVTRSAPASAARPVPGPDAAWPLLALATLAPLLARATRRA